MSRTSLRIAASTFLALFVTTTSATAIDLKPNLSKPPSDSFEFRQVYGSINYFFEISKKKPAAAQAPPWFVFLRDLVNKLFKVNKTATYLLTATVRTGTEVVARKAVYELSYNNGAKGSVEFVSTNGTLVEHFPVTGGTNQLGVSLQLNKSDASSLDLTTFNKLSEQLATLRLPLLQAAFSVLPALKGPLEAIASVVEGSTSEDFTSEVTLSFIKKSVSEGYTTVEYVFSAGPNATVTIRIWTDVVQSYLGSILAGETKFSNLQLDLVDLNPQVSSNKSLMFRDAIDKTSKKTLYDTLASLDLGRLPESTDAAAVCSTLFNGVKEFFSTADAMAEYAAWVKEKRTLLSQAACIDPRKDTLLAFGIPLDQIDFDH